jgi:Trk-type K+ transport system membrane component
MPGLWRDRITSLVLLGGAALAWRHAMNFPRESAMFPLLVLGILGGLGVILLVQSFLPQLRTASDRLVIEEPRTLLVAISVTIAYLFFVPVIGYFTSSLIYIVALSRLLGFKNYLALIAISVGYVLLTYIVFALLFQLPLPPEFFQT